MNSVIKNKYLPKLTKLAVYLGVFWILFLLGRSLWQNWDLKHSIWKLTDQIATLEQQKKDLENLNLYYKSDSFKELEARRKLGLKKPEEKIFIIADTSPALSNTNENFSEEINKEKEKIAGLEAPSKIPNWLLWWQYFTK